MNPIAPTSETFRQSSAVMALREQIQGLEAPRRRRRSHLPFGVRDIDRALPGRGLMLGALHEIAGSGLQAVHGVAPALFVAGILARLRGPVLWCVRARDLFAPALAQAGLDPARVLFADAGTEQAVWQSMEEGLRYRGLAGVVGEVSALPMTESRRLHLAAGESGVVCLALRRWRSQQEANDFGRPTASVSRWRITPAPSDPLPVPGIGRPRWRVELMRCRGAEGANWVVEACDATGSIRLATDLVHGSVAPAIAQRAAS